MKKLWIKLLLCSVICLGLLGGLYVAVAKYYQNGFMLNTWINGIYCTGHSVEEVNETLLANTKVEDTFMVVGYNGVGEDCEIISWALDYDEISRKLDYEESLHEFLQEQSPWKWLFTLKQSRIQDLQPVISCDENALENWFNDVSAVSETEEEYRVLYQPERGYYLLDGLHNRLDKKKAYQIIKEAILSGENQVNLVETECYYDVPLNAKQEETAVIWAKLNHFQTSGPVYDFKSEQLQISAADMTGFIEISNVDDMPFWDDKGAPLISKEKVETWIKQLAEEYDTYERNWTFESTRGDVVDVKGVTYGTKMDQKKEAEWLHAYIKRVAAEEEITTDVRIPEYTKGSYDCSGKEIGDTYVEVDMGTQKLYYYVDGELKLETDVVTGNMRRRMDTPEGLNYVYSKQKNRVLRGPGYATPVKFWMPVKGAIGIHDATWRDEFGGEIYKTSGSHGCVNIPVDVAAELYDMIEIGTPVVMFYGEDPYDDEAKTN